VVLHTEVVLDRCCLIGSCSVPVTRKMQGLIEMLAGWQSCAAVVVVDLVSVVVVVVGEVHAVVVAVAVDSEPCWSAAHSWPPLALGKAT